MTVLQVLFFLLAALVMTVVGWLLLVNSICSNDMGKLYKGLIGTFAAKMVIGVIALVVGWKVLQIPVKITVYGVMGAYLIALFITTVAALSQLKQGRGKT